MTDKEKLTAIKAEIERLKDVLVDPLCKPLTSDYKAGANKIVSTLSQLPIPKGMGLPHYH